MKKFLVLICLVFVGALTACVSEDESLKEITGITFVDKEVEYTGSEFVIEITGTLPSGTEVVYSNNKGTNIAVYNATATISGEGYKTLVLTAKLTITEVLQDITGFTLSNKEVVYNGEEHTVLLDQEVGDFNVVYTNNKKVDAGTYNVEAKITKVGYRPLTLTSTLTINKANIVDITFEEKEVTYDGEEHIVEIFGTLPEGVTVTYTNNRGTENGVYEATATISGKNYNTLVLKTTLTIKRGIGDLAGLALETLGNILDLPDAWSFLPESFKLEEKEGITQLDYTSFNSISSIGTGGIGKQMNVVYDTLLQTDTLLGYVSPISTALSTIVTLYQDFINKNPDDYSEFNYTGNQVPFKFKIVLDNKDVTLLASLATANIELSVNAEEKVNSARIQLSDSNSLKYEYSEGELRLAVNILNTFVSELNFVTNEFGITSGVLYEFTDVKVTNPLKTTSYITITDNVTAIICNKRETDDLPVTAKVEVYNNEDGNMIGNFVDETLSLLNYETLWFNLEDFTGFTNIKCEDGIKNGTNLDSFYINNQSTKFTSKRIGLTNFSRRYDIEYITKYSYDFNSQTGKYVKNEIKVPMIFIQRDNIDDFSSDVVSENNYLSNVTLKNNADDVLCTMYDALIDNYKALKELHSLDLVIDYIGQNNEYFN